MSSLSNLRSTGIFATQFKSSPNSVKQQQEAFIQWLQSHSRDVGNCLSLSSNCTKYVYLVQGGNPGSLYGLGRPWLQV